MASLSSTVVCYGGIDGVGAGGEGAAQGLVLLGSNLIDGGNWWIVDTV